MFNLIVEKIDIIRKKILIYKRKQIVVFANINQNVRRNGERRGKGNGGRT